MAAAVATPTETISNLVADCKRERLPQSRTRIAALLAFRLTPVLAELIDDDRFEQARELLAAYWTYLVNPRNAAAVREASDGEIRQMLVGYRARRARRDGTPLSVLSRGVAYERWLIRLRGPALRR